LVISVGSECFVLGESRNLNVGTILVKLQYHFSTCLFVLAFQQQEGLLQTSKVEIEFSMLFGLDF